MKNSSKKGNRTLIFTHVQALKTPERIRGVSNSFDATDYLLIIQKSSCSKRT